MVIRLARDHKNGRIGVSRRSARIHAHEMSASFAVGLIAGRCRSSEPEVDTSVEGMGLCLPGVNNLERWVDRNRAGGDRLFAQVIVKILSLPTPVLAYPDFSSTA